jgi:hypothetical protein
VYCPVWLHRATAQFIISDEKTVTRLQVENNNMTLHHYSIDGELKKSINCVFNTDTPFLGNSLSNPLMVGFENSYYTYVGKHLIIVSASGHAQAIFLGTLIRYFAASVSFDKSRIVISTNKGCLLYDPNGYGINPESGFFAEDIIPSSISFIHGHRFVIVEKNKAWLFEISGPKPHPIQEFVTHSFIIGAIPVAGRHQFALVEASGKITVCDVNL